MQNEIRYYPICLDLTGKNSLVVGGGNVAERKVKSLLSTGASVCVISPELNDELEELKERGDITYIKDEFNDSCLDNIFIVIGAADNPDVNSFVSREAIKRNMLVNIADSPDECNFIVPAIVERGDLLISVSTSGNSPALAKKIRKELEKKYSVEYSMFLEIMGEMRSHIISEFSSPEIRNKVFSEIAVHADEMIDIIKRCGKDKARERIEEIIKVVVQIKNRG